MFPIPQEFKNFDEKKNGLVFSVLTQVLKACKACKVLYKSESNKFYTLEWYVTLKKEQKQCV